MTRPAIAVVVISDYGGRSDGEWDYLRATLGALGRQVTPDAAEVVLVDSTPPDQTMPADVPELVPGVRVLRDDRATTTALLNAAVQSTSADLVAFLDGDCAPVPGWIAAAHEAMRAHPDAAAVSGRTAYPTERLAFRILAVLSRAYVDPGRAGRTGFISGNNAVFRRAALLAHPLGPQRRPMALRLQTEAIRLAGGALYFEPGMQVTHRFQGWPQERRIRRHVGYRAVRLRQLEPRLSHARLVRLGPASIPLILAGRVLESWGSCVRAGRHYGLRWFELPAAFATAVAVHLLEIPGMLEAFAEQRTGRTAPAYEAR
jgi:hypothetical protein